MRSSRNQSIAVQQIDAQLCAEEEAFDVHFGLRFEKTVSLHENCVDWAMWCGGPESRTLD